MQFLSGYATRLDMNTFIKALGWTLAVYVGLFFGWALMPVISASSKNILAFIIFTWLSSWGLLCAKEDDEQAKKNGTYDYQNDI